MIASGLFKLLVITVAITAVRTKRKATPCATRCYHDQQAKNINTMMRLVGEEYIEETRPGTHCDTKCKERCLHSQDPGNTRYISQICSSLSSLCDYTKDTGCVRHVVKTLSKRLPLTVDRAEETPNEKTSLYDYSDTKCPVCMNPEAANKVDCVSNREKTESCPAEDSCWVYELTESLTVPLNPPLVLDKVIRCQPNDQVAKGCTHKSCKANKFERVEDIAMSTAEGVVTTTAQSQVVTRNKTAAATTKAAVKKSEKITEKPDDTNEAATTKAATEKITEKPDDTNKAATTKAATKKPVTEKSDDTHADSSADSDGRTAEVTTEIENDTTNDVTDDVTDDITNDIKCSVAVNNCEADKPNCYGYKLKGEDEFTKFECSDLDSPDCNQGCAAACAPHDGLPCGLDQDEVTTQQTTTKPATTPQGESTTKKEVSNETEEEDGKLGAVGSSDADESSHATTLLFLFVGLLFY